jgi:hypothetical protein
MTTDPMDDPWQDLEIPHLLDTGKCTAACLFADTPMLDSLDPGCTCACQGLYHGMGRSACHWPLDVVDLWISNIRYLASQLFDTKRVGKQLTEWIQDPADRQSWLSRLRDKFELIRLDLVALELAGGVPPGFRRAPTGDRQQTTPVEESALAGKSGYEVPISDKARLIVEIFEEDPPDARELIAAASDPGKLISTWRAIADDMERIHSRSAATQDGNRPTYLGTLQ